MTERKTEAALAKALGVSYDAHVFPLEHGITTLIPYIARYFPNARVAAVAVGGEPPVNQSNAEKLTSALAPYFTRRNRKHNFLKIRNAHFCFTRHRTSFREKAKTTLQVIIFRCFIRAEALIPRRLRRGIKADCNHLMRTTTPTLASGLLIKRVNASLGSIG